MVSSLKQRSSVILILLIFGLSAAQAQFKNILLDAEGAYEPSVAVSRGNTQSIVVSAAPDNIYYTRNGGASWDKTNLTTAFGTTASMTLIANFKSSFYCVHQAVKNGKSKIVIQESSNGGKTWSEGALISTDTNKYAVNPRIAVDRKGNLLVTWTEFDSYGSDEQTCFSNAVLSRSSNGRKWSKPVQLSQTSGNCINDVNTVAGAMPAVMGEGERAFAVWSNQQKVFFDRAFDGGGTWLSNDLAVSNQAGGWKQEIPGTKKATAMPALICNNTRKTSMSGALYLIWADQQSEGKDTDIWFSRSLNFGDNWEQRHKVNDDSSAKHQYLPAMTLDAETGNLYVLSYDRRNSTDETTDVYLAYSTDNGAKFKNVKINEASFVSDASAPLGDFIGIAAHQGVVTAAWTRNENGKSSVWVSVFQLKDLEGSK